MNKIDDIFGKIDFRPEFADTHGGCPPMYRGGVFTGKDEAKAQLIASIESVREMRSVHDETWNTALDEVLKALGLNDIDA
jgi:hypothetical protein